MCRSESSACTSFHPHDVCTEAACVASSILQNLQGSTSARRFASHLSQEPQRAHDTSRNRFSSGDPATPRHCVGKCIVQETQVLTFTSSHGKLQPFASQQ